MPSDAPAVGNVLLGYKFRFEVNGMDPLLITGFDPPEDEIEVVEVPVGAGQESPVSQSGGKKAKEFEIELLMRAKGPERQIIDEWMQAALTHDTAQYWKDATMMQMGPNDEPSVIWDIEDAWPPQQSWDKFESEGKDKAVKIKVKFRCNECKRRYQ